MEKQDDNLTPRVREAEEQPAFTSYVKDVAEVFRFFKLQPFKPNGSKIWPAALAFGFLNSVGIYARLMVDVEGMAYMSDASISAVLFAIQFVAIFIGQGLLCGSVQVLGGMYNVGCAAIFQLIRLLCGVPLVISGALMKGSGTRSTAYGVAMASAWIYAAATIAIGLVQSVAERQTKRTKNWALCVAACLVVDCGAAAGVLCLFYFTGSK